jgi:hypothetical protein
LTRCKRRYRIRRYTVPGQSRAAAGAGVGTVRRGNMGTKGRKNVKKAKQPKEKKPAAGGKRK